MNHMEHLKNIPWAAQEELYAELSKVSNVAALSPQERAVYNETLKQYRDNLATLEASYLDGKAEGFKDGEAKGFKDGKAEVARKMLAKDADIEFIVEITGLTPDEIEALK